MVLDNNGRVKPRGRMEMIDSMIWNARFSVEGKRLLNCLGGRGDDDTARTRDATNSTVEFSQ